MDDGWFRLTDEVGGNAQGHERDSHVVAVLGCGHALWHASDLAIGERDCYWEWRGLGRIVDCFKYWLLVPSALREPGDRLLARGMRLIPGGSPRPNP